MRVETFTDGTTIVRISERNAHCVLERADDAYPMPIMCGDVYLDGEEIFGRVILTTGEYLGDSEIFVEGYAYDIRMTHADLAIATGTLKAGLPWEKEIKEKIKLVVETDDTHYIYRKPGM